MIVSNLISQDLKYPPHNLCIQKSISWENKEIDELRAKINNMEERIQKRREKGKLIVVYF